MRKQVGRAALCVLALGGVGAAPLPQSYHVILGQAGEGKGPDGNSIFIDAPRGLILVDTGRHPEHRDKLLAYAKNRGRPIVAIVNTHWHYDHTTGNREILAAYPRAEVIASRAVDGRLYKDFIAESRRNTKEYLASGKATEAQKAEIKRAFAVMDDPSALRSPRPVDRSGPRRIGGRMLQVHLAKYAASEGDVWLYDPRAKVAVVGDLVVGIVPFMDTACPDGWARALDEVAKVPFTTLIPGHGEPMSRADFLQWRTAYNNYLKCGRSTASMKSCAEGWLRDAAKFVDDKHRAYVDEAAAYYIETRLRSSPQEQQRFCPPLKKS
jgi:glyoxylase-like metal-dependent hydrolase (beta-lactamase superfamily II)